MSNVTYILQAIEAGDSQAAEKLLPIVYEELRRLAAQKLSHEKAGQTLQATALVHEAYIRLVEAEDQSWESRGHFFRAAAEAMRRILIENARRKKSLKRGGNRKRFTLEEEDAIVNSPSEDLLALDEALTKLAEEEGEIVELIKLRYFAGLTFDQAAQVMGISSSAASRYWAYGRAKLLQEITQDGRKR